MSSLLRPEQTTVSNVLTTDSSVKISSIELVKIINDMRVVGQATLRHNNFCEKVKSVLGEGIAAKFSATIKREQPNGGYREYPCYYFPKREASLMVMSESYKVQAKVYDRMIELEKANEPKLPSNYIEALKALVVSEEQKQVFLTKIEEDAPKVEFYEAVADTKGMILFNIFARTLDLGRNNAYKWARDNNLLYKVGKSHIPHQKWINAGWFVVKEALTPTNGSPYNIILVTGKGQIKLQQAISSGRFDD